MFFDHSKVKKSQSCQQIKQPCQISAPVCSSSQSCVQGFQGWTGPRGQQGLSVQGATGDPGPQGWTGPMGSSNQPTIYRCATLYESTNINFLDADVAALLTVTQVDTITKDNTKVDVSFPVTVTQVDLTFNETGTQQVIARVTNDVAEQTDILVIVEVKECIPTGGEDAVIYAICHARGDAAIDQSLEPTLIKFDYNSNSNSGAGIVTKLAFADETGSVWGLDYHASSDHLFAAQRLKRWSVLLTDAAGDEVGESIYMTSAVSTAGPYTTTKFIDSTLIANFPKVGADISASRLPLEPFGPGNTGDPAGINEDGKFGLGGLKLSADGKSLFVVNLNSRQIFKMPIGTAADPLTPLAYTVADSRNSEVISIDFDTDIVAVLGLPTFTDAQVDTDIKFFGLTVHKGELFIGAVNSSYSTENSDFSGSLDRLRVYVIAVKESDMTNPRKVLDFNLNYQRGSKVFDTARGSTWRPWIDPATGGGISRRIIDNGETETYTIFTNTIQTAIPNAVSLAFDSNGYLNVGMEDMTANWFFEAAPNFVRREVDDGAPNYLSCASSGDVIRAKPSGNIWVVDPLEYPPDNDTFAPPTWRNRYPSGRYYALEYPGQPNHQQPFVGGISVLPRSNEIVCSVIDAYTFNSGDFTTLTTTGDGPDASQEVRKQTVYVGANTAFGKGNGLGSTVVGYLCQDLSSQIDTDTNPNI